MFLPKLRIVWSPSASLRISPATRPWPTFQYVELTTGISAMVKILIHGINARRRAGPSCHGNARPGL